MIPITVNAKYVQLARLARFQDTRLSVYPALLEESVIRIQAHAKTVKQANIPDGLDARPVKLARTRLLVEKHVQRVRSVNTNPKRGRAAAKGATLVSTPARLGMLVKWRPYTPAHLQVCNAPPVLPAQTLQLAKQLALIAL